MLGAINRVTILQVALLDIQEEAGQEACETLRKIYGQDKVTFYKCDVTSAENFVRDRCLVYICYDVLYIVVSRGLFSRRL